MNNRTSLPDAPELLTFDIFGTVLDWRTGLEAACEAAGRPLREGEFDRIVDAQGALEQGSFLDYSEITRRSLVEAIGLPDAAAAQIGANAGRWPLYADSSTGLRALMGIAPCAAMTNSDRVHGEQIQRQLGFRLDDWLCAEEVRAYKPDAVFWQVMGGRRGMNPSRRWWHVSAYADYDLAVANELGLTTVFVERPHARPGAASVSVRDLNELVARIRG
jgi:2-haloacid dehalogenase